MNIVNQNRNQEIKRIFLWAHPRSISTAFERIFIERDDTFVFHEPYSMYFFFSSKRGHDRFNDTQSKPEFEFDYITKTILATKEKPIVFIKDMALYLRNDLNNHSFFDMFTHTFMIRQPEQALLSMYKKWPDFDFVEAGYQDLLRLYDTISNRTGKNPIVIDANDFCNAPSSMVREYCNLLGIDFSPSTLTWKKKEIDIWKTWSGWHDQALNSTGIYKRDEKSPDISFLPKQIQDYIAKCRYIYEYLYDKRITP